MHVRLHIKIRVIVRREHGLSRTLRNLRGLLLQWLIVLAREPGGVIGTRAYPARQGISGRHWYNGLTCTPKNLGALLVQWPIVHAREPGGVIGTGLLA